MTALVIVAVMVLMYSVPTAFAGSLTIKNELAGYTYEAYQIFTGDQADGKLSNVRWGTAIASNDIQDFLDELKTKNVIAEEITYNSLNPSASAVALSNALDRVSDNSDTAKALADVAGKYATVKTGDAVSTQTTVSGNKVYQFTGLPDGYYLVKNTAKSGDSDTQKETTFSELSLKL